MANILTVEGLETQFSTQDGIVHAVNGVSFHLKEGETLGIVGESGCGKSVTMMSMMRLIPMPPGKVVAGRALFHGKDLLKLSDAEIRSVRGSQITFIFQDPMTSFNPVLTIGRQLSEPSETHMGMTPKQANDRSAELLAMVGIPNAKDRLNDYPHQFSGGMRQRAMIAMALVCTPQILIADEPTTALDVTIQAQIIELVKSLRDKLGMAIIWITHDLGIIAGLADRVGVMYGGYIVEEATVKDLYARSLTIPIRSGCWAACRAWMRAGADAWPPSMDCPPVLMQKPNFCPFAPRCKYVIDRCWTENPTLTEVASDHRSRLLGRYPQREAARMSNDNNILLRVENLVKYFPVMRSRYLFFPYQAGAVHAVDDVSFYRTQGRNAGAGGRVGLRQIDHRARDPAAAPPHLGARLLRRHRPGGD